MWKNLITKALNYIREVFKIPFEKKKSLEEEKIKKAAHRDFQDIWSGDQVFKDEKIFYKIKYPKDNSYWTEYYHSIRPTWANYPPTHRDNESTISWTELDLRENLIQRGFTDACWKRGGFNKKEFIELYTDFALKYNKNHNVLDHAPMFTTKNWFVQTEHAVHLNLFAKNAINTMNNYYDNIYQLWVMNSDLDVLVLLTGVLGITKLIIHVNETSGLGLKIINFFTNIFS